MKTFLFKGRHTANLSLDLLAASWGTRFQNVDRPIKAFILLSEFFSSFTYIQEDHLSVRSLASRE